MTSYIDLPLSGLEAPLSEMEELIQDTCHRFAVEVLRPAGPVLDEMAPEETLAPESPLWRVLEQAQELGLSVAAMLEMDELERSRLLLIRMQRDPRLEAFNQGNTHLLKFRHLRWLAQREGRILTLHDLTENVQFRSDLTPIEQLNSLVSAKIIKLTAKGELLLNCDVRETTLGVLYNKLPWKLPNVKALPDHPHLATFKRAMHDVDISMKSGLDESLGSLFKEEPLLSS